MDKAKSLFLDGAAGRLHLTDFGGDGPALLALHGVTGGGFLWAALARELRGQARIMTLDFRGHGQSDWSDTRAYQTADFITDLAAILDQADFGNQTPCILGSSWGALAAIGLLAAQPQRASGLIIVDVEPSFETSETDVFPRPYRFATIDAAVAWEARANPNAAPADLSAFATASLVETREGHWLRRHDPYFLTRWPFRNDNRWHELETLQQRVQVVHGGKSFVRRAVCERMAALQPSWGFTEIENAGHLVPLEQPKALAGVVKAFLSTR
jgi:pimeloyl-ACP methyl ester carboxylesterase